MRAVIQRVLRSKVTVGGRGTGAIGPGLLILLGVGLHDTRQDAEYLAEKIAGLRVFEDSDGKMNLDLAQIKGSVLIVSQFTLYGDCRRGKRPSYSEAALPDKADTLYQYFIEKMKAKVSDVQEGRFGAKMLVSLDNDGPVTLILESPKKMEV
jgi:D-aminoacyl-tRNA deacylase